MTDELEVAESVSYGKQSMDNLRTSCRKLLHTRLSLGRYRDPHQSSSNPLQEALEDHRPVA